MVVQVAAAVVLGSDISNRKKAARNHVVPGLDCGAWLGQNAFAFWHRFGQAAVAHEICAF